MTVSPGVIAGGAYQNCSNRIADNSAITVLGTSATGAMYGGISGAGRSEADTTENVLNDAQNAALTSGIISGEVTPDELKTESSKPTRSKEELFQLKKEYEFNRKKYKDDPEAIKILDNEARLDGLIK